MCLKAITLLHFAQSTHGLFFQVVYKISFCLDVEDELKGAQMHSSYQRKVSLIQDQFVKALQIHMSQCCKFWSINNTAQFVSLVSNKGSEFKNKF